MKKFMLIGILGLMVAANIYAQKSDVQLIEETVFEFASEGDIFYVILSGLVSVQTPITEFEVETYKRAATIGSKVSFFNTDPDTIVEKKTRKQEKLELMKNNSKRSNTNWEDENSFDSQNEPEEGTFLSNLP